MATKTPEEIAKTILTQMLTVDENDPEDGVFDSIEDAVDAGFLELNHSEVILFWLTKAATEARNG